MIKRITYKLFEKHFKRELHQFLPSLAVYENLLLNIHPFLRLPDLKLCFFSFTSATLTELGIPRERNWLVWGT